MKFESFKDLIVEMLSYEPEKRPSLNEIITWMTYYKENLDLDAQKKFEYKNNARRNFTRVVNQVYLKMQFRELDR